MEARRFAGRCQHSSLRPMHASPPSPRRMSFPTLAIVTSVGPPRNVRDTHHRRHVAQMGEAGGPFRAQVQKREIVLKENARPSKGGERTKNSAHEGIEDIIDADPKSNKSGWVAACFYAVQQIDHAPVLHQHALRLARAARRVDHVRQVVRPRARRRRRARAHSHARRLRLRHASRVVQREHRAAEPPRVLRR
eukprot:scaffold22718_cov64-Phaeocystis_antarctica.AAC.4